MIIASLQRYGARYLGVSLFCLLVNNALFIALDHMGLWFGWSVVISTIILTPLGFTLQSLATYDRELNWVAFRRYALAMAANPFLVFLLLWLIRDLANVPMIMAAPLVTGLMFVWNFATSNWAILLRR